jgi:hypothetical protein
MPATLCEHCTGVCCRYIALPIDAPRTRADFDDVRWYLLHEGVSVFVEDDEWYVSFQTTCRHLQPDHRCGIYSTRPRICRSYSTDSCDYHSGDYGWQHHFSCPEHLDAYVRVRGVPARKRGTRRRTRVRRRLHLGIGHRLHANAPRAAATRAAADGRVSSAAILHGIPLPVLPFPTN